MLAAILFLAFVTPPVPDRAAPDVPPEFRLDPAVYRSFGLASFGPARPPKPEDVTALRIVNLLESWVGACKMVADDLRRWYDTAWHLVFGAGGLTGCLVLLILQSLVARMRT